MGGRLWWTETHTKLWNVTPWSYLTSYQPHSSVEATQQQLLWKLCIFSSYLARAPCFKLQQMWQDIFGSHSIYISLYSKHDIQRVRSIYVKKIMLLCNYFCNSSGNPHQLWLQLFSLLIYLLIISEKQQKLLSCPNNTKAYSVYHIVSISRQLFW